MPQKIFKYEIKPTKFQLVEIPVGGQVIHVGMQDNSEKLCLWVIHQTNQPSDLPATEKMGIEIFGTGHEIPDTLYTRKFLKTVQAGEYLVWHVFRLWNFEGSAKQ